MRTHALLAALLAALAVSGASACASKTHDDHLSRIAELEDDNDELRRENSALRARVEGNVTPVPAIETRCAKTAAGWKITPSGLDEILKNATGLKREARARAFFDGGRYTGMRLTAPAGSFAASCGCEEGDVLQRVNGVDFNPSKYGEIGALLRKTKKIELEVARGGATRTLAIEVAP